MHRSTDERRATPGAAAGFSLVELLVVLGIAVVLLAIALPNVSGLM